MCDLRWWRKPKIDMHVRRYVLLFVGTEVLCMGSYKVTMKQVHILHRAKLSTFVLGTVSMPKTGCIIAHMQ